MIIKGRCRGHAGQLAAYLFAAKNERVEVVEPGVCGKVEASLNNMAVTGELLTASEKPLYHASMRLAEGESLSTQQWQDSIDRLGAALNLADQDRVVVLHTLPDGSTHAHIVWSRVDAENGRVISNSWDAVQWHKVSRDLERELGLRQLREGADERSRSQLQASKSRSVEDGGGRETAIIREELTFCWNASDTGGEFQEQLRQMGYELRVGERSAYVVTDTATGKVYNPARLIDGIRTKDLRDRCGSLELPPDPGKEQRKQPQPIMEEEQDKPTFREAYLEKAKRNAGIPQMRQQFDDYIAQRRKDEEDQEFARRYDAKYRAEDAGYGTFGEQKDRHELEAGLRQSEDLESAELRNLEEYKQFDTWLKVQQHSMLRADYRERENYIGGSALPMPENFDRRKDPFPTRVTLRTLEAAELRRDFDTFQSEVHMSRLEAMGVVHDANMAHIAEGFVKEIELQQNLDKSLDALNELKPTTLRDRNDSRLPVITDADVAELNRLIVSEEPDQTNDTQLDRQAESDTRNEILIPAPKDRQNDLTPHDASTDVTISQTARDYKASLTRVDRNDGEEVTAPEVTEEEIGETIKVVPPHPQLSQAALDYKAATDASQAIKQREDNERNERFFSSHDEPAGETRAEVQLELPLPEPKKIVPEFSR